MTALREQLAKEKATSRDNLKKVMKVTQEKKALELLLEEQIAGGGSTSEAEVAALSAQAEQLQRQLSAKTAEAKELEEELEGAKEEVEPATRLGEPNADTPLTTRLPAHRCCTGRTRPRLRPHRPRASRRARLRSGRLGTSRSGWPRRSRRATLPQPTASRRCRRAPRLRAAAPPLTAPLCTAPPLAATHRAAAAHRASPRRSPRLRSSCTERMARPHRAAKAVLHEPTPTRTRSRGRRRWRASKRRRAISRRRSDPDPGSTPAPAPAPAPSPKPHRRPLPHRRPHPHCSPHPLPQ